MDWETMEWLLRFARHHRIQTLDLTGGAPEMNPHFRDLVVAARRMRLRVIDRCNLTILAEPGWETLAAFLAAQRVDVVASLPCYLEENVDRQRGPGTFAASIAGLRALNHLGYGDAGSELVLNLVYNPGGPTLPPNQQLLEATYRERLESEFGIRFNHLFVIVNMPIRRFKERLASLGQLEAYQTLLEAAYSPENLDRVMCRSLVSVDWQGYAYDCDFNQMLDLPLGDDRQERVHLSALIERDLSRQAIRVDSHCFGCSAGQGSSCQGALAA